MSWGNEGVRTAVAIMTLHNDAIKIIEGVEYEEFNCPLIVLQSYCIAI